MANINYWQIGIYKKIGSEYIEVSRLDDPAEYQHLLAALHYANHDEVEGDSSFYVSSPGTCQGDYGLRGNLHSASGKDYRIGQECLSFEFGEFK